MLTSLYFTLHHPDTLLQVVDTELLRSSERLCGFLLMIDCLWAWWYALYAAHHRQTVHKSGHDEGFCRCWVYVDWLVFWQSHAQPWCTQTLSLVHRRERTGDNQQLGQVSQRIVQSTEQEIMHGTLG